jgi:hypothetical protein
VGEAHRNPLDPSVPEIGDELAVARALRNLAERLLHTTEKDIKGVTGESAHLRRETPADAAGGLPFPPGGRSRHPVEVAT